MSRLTVRLSREELSDCSQAAALRSQLARASGVANQRRDGARTDREIDEAGIKGECAVSKVLEIPFVASKLGIDSGADLWFCDKSIDVKTTFYPTGLLLFKTDKSFRADCAVLVSTTDEEAVMTVHGYISRPEFLRVADTRDLGWGPGRCVDQDALRPMHQLLKLKLQQYEVSDD